jgi:hypothetical protein
MTPMEIRLMLESALPFILALAALGTGGRIVSAWLRSRGAATSQKELRAISEQLRQLQESVDTMAVEVERIEESQRFNARLLAEGRVPPGSGRT